jgi:cytochrome c-type biogenesis protein CcmF
MEAVSPANKISVGPPYYNLVFAPLAVPLLLLVTAGPMLAWKRDDLRGVAAKLAVPALLAGGMLAGLALWLGAGGAAAAIGLALGAWLLLGAAMVLVRRWWGASGFSWRLVRTTPAATVGLALAHAGLGVTTAGIAAMSQFAAEKILVMRPGDTATAGPVRVTMQGAAEVTGANYRALRATFAVAQGGSTTQLVSERRLYGVSRNSTTEAGIGATLLGNRYVAIGDVQDDGRGGQGLVVRIYWHPLVGWIWAGGLLMALGGAASLADRRFRIGAPVVRAAALPPLAAAAVPAE